MIPSRPSRLHRGGGQPTPRPEDPGTGNAGAEESWRHGSIPPAVWSARTFWLFQAGFWLLSVLSLSFMIRTFRPAEHVNAIIAGRVITGLLLTVLLHHAYQHHAIRAKTGVTKWLRISGLTLAVVLASSVVWLGLIRWAGFYELEADNLFFNLTISRLFALLIWNSMYFGIEVFRTSQAIKLEAARAKLAARSAELSQLQAQLNPHFLFNALNTIKASVADPALTEEVTQNLADYLRFALQESRPLEPLSRELDSLDLYFKIQRVRFGKDLDCRMEIAPSTLDVMVPPMLVQPLLENAFKYGPKTSPAPLRILVKVAIEDPWLELEVTNSGTWIETTPETSAGTGLSNLRRRLSLLLGRDATLTVFHDADRVTVRIRLPLTPAAVSRAGSTPPLGLPVD